MTYDIPSILARLPHRYPFVMVDRIISITRGEQIQALKNITFNEPFFQGHFPDEPVMPGVLVVEAMAQAGSILAVESWEQTGGHGKKLYLAAVDKAKFRKKIIPGDQLVLNIHILKIKNVALKMKGIATVDGAVVAEAEFTAILGEDL